MRSRRGSHGRFASLYGTTTLRLGVDFQYPPDGPRYELLVVDGSGQLIVPLNEWYLLMRVEGWFVQATNKSPISTNGMHLVIAALRNFYEVMRRGVFDSEDQRLHPLYPFENPMYSRVMRAWRSEHRKWIRNAGAPDYAGIRSRSREDAARQPVGFFQVKRQPLEPPVARDSEPTRLVILAGVRYMIDHAPPRDAVILRILLESGARVSEILGLTARGLRQVFADSERRVTTRVRAPHLMCRRMCGCHVLFANGRRLSYK